MDNLSWHQQKRLQREHQLRGVSAHIESDHFWATGRMLCGRRDTPVKVDLEHAENPKNRTCKRCLAAAVAAGLINSNKKGA